MCIFWWIERFVFNGNYTIFVIIIIIIISFTGLSSNSRSFPMSVDILPTVTTAGVSQDVDATHTNDVSNPIDPTVAKYFPDPATTTTAIIVFQPSPRLCEKCDCRLRLQHSAVLIPLVAFTLVTLLVFILLVVIVVQCVVIKRMWKSSPTRSAPPANDHIYTDMTTMAPSTTTGTISDMTTVATSTTTGTTSYCNNQTE